MAEPHVAKAKARVSEAEIKKVEVDQTGLSQMKLAISLLSVVCFPPLTTMTRPIIYVR
jgi:hypothetical protein